MTRRKVQGKTGVTVTVTGLSLRCFSSSSIFELELKHLKLNPVTVTVTPVFPVHLRKEMCKDPQLIDAYLAGVFPEIRD